MSTGHQARPLDLSRLRQDLRRDVEKLQELLRRQTARRLAEFALSTNNQCAIISQKTEWRWRSDAETLPVRGRT